MSQELLMLGEARGGVLTTRDATRLDVDANALAALVRSRAIVRVPVTGVAARSSMVSAESGVGVATGILQGRSGGA